MSKDQSELLTMNPQELWQALSPEQKSHLERINLLLWARNKVQKIDGKPFSFKNYEFLKEIYETEFEEAVIQKCAQIGATVFAINWFIHKVGIHGKNGIYYFPNDTAISAFVQSRFNPMLRENPSLAYLVADTDNTRVKRIGSAFGHFYGLAGRAQKLSTPADVLVFDELDAAPGPKDVETAEERLGASENPQKLFLSTPTFPNFGINKKFLKTDQRQRGMKCPRCGSWNISPSGDPNPHYEEMKFPECIEQGFLACRHCKKPLEGCQERWIPKTSAYKTPGWHITRLISPIWRRRCPQMLENYRNATNIQNFFNSALGLPFADGENMVSREHILSLCAQYPMFSPNEAWNDMQCTAGVDVGRQLHVVISRPSTIPGKIREYLFIGTTQGAGMEKFKELGIIFNRFRVRKFVIDGQPETSAVEDFLEKFKFKGYACFYKTKPLVRKWVNPGTVQHVNNLPVVTKVGKYEVNRTEHLDASQKYLYQKDVVFPRQCIAMEDFASHCVAIARMEVIDEKTGDKTYQWVQNETEPDHYRHAFGYDVACWDDRATSMPSGTMKVPSDIDKAGRRKP